MNVVFQRRESQLFEGNVERDAAVFKAIPFLICPCSFCSSSSKTSCGREKSKPQI